MPAPISRVVKPPTDAPTVILTGSLTQPTLVPTKPDYRQPVAPKRVTETATATVCLMMPTPAPTKLAPLLPMVAPMPTATVHPTVLMPVPANPAQAPMAALNPKVLCPQTPLPVVKNHPPNPAQAMTRPTPPMTKHVVMNAARLMCASRNGNEGLNTSAHQSIGPHTNVAIFDIDIGTHRLQSLHVQVDGPRSDCAAAW